MRFYHVCHPGARFDRVDSLGTEVAEFQIGVWRQGPIYRSVLILVITSELRPRPVRAVVPAANCYAPPQTH